MFKRFFHLTGAILLIAGTAIGAGMLALPVLTSQMGFIPSAFLFTVLWVVMLFSAFFFIDLSCHFKEKINLFSMAQQTIGKAGKFFASLFYLLLLYSLTAAYMAGSGDLIVQLLPFEFPSFYAALVLPVIFLFFLLLSTRGVDLCNRALMVVLFGSYAFLIGALPGHFHGNYLLHSDWSKILVGIPIVLASFGYHIVLPSLAHYMDYSRAKLYQAAIWGSVISLAVYLLWQLFVFAAVPLDGKFGLLSALAGGNSISFCLEMLHSTLVTSSVKIFSLVAIATSFLGVSLSLVDFLKDAFQIKRKAHSFSVAVSLAFLPPIFFLLTYPKAFLIALQYAGFFVAFLLIFLPAWMAISLIKKEQEFFRKRFFYYGICILSTVMMGVMLFL